MKADHQWININFLLCHNFYLLLFCPILFLFLADFEVSFFFFPFWKTKTKIKNHIKKYIGLIWCWSSCRWSRRLQSIEASKQKEEGESKACSWHFHPKFVHLRVSPQANDKWDACWYVPITTPSEETSGMSNTTFLLFFM